MPSSLRGPADRSSPRRQRGVISILAAMGLAAVVASAALAVDLGSLFYTKRQLQKAADTAALSAVNDLTIANGIALDTASLNDFPVPGVRGNTLQTVTGAYDFNTHLFTPGGDPLNQNAVEVTVTTNQPYFFMLGNRQITATATAARTDIAGLSIGSGLLSINTEKSALLNAILGKLLKTSLQLDAVSYNGLANANVRLLDLVKAQATAGTVQELLDLDLTLVEWLELTATALRQTDVGNVNLSAIDALELLAAHVSGDLRLKLGDLIDAHLAPGNAAAQAQINVLQLITLSAQVANGKHFLDVPVLGIDLPGVLKLDLALSLIEPPSIAIGPAGQDGDGKWRTQAHTAQARLKIDVQVGEVLGGLVHLPIYLEIAAGDAWLESIECRSPRDNSTVNIGATSGILRAYIGEVNTNAMTNVTSPATVKKATILNLLGLLTVTTRVAIDFPGGAGNLAFNGPFDSKNTQRISGLSTAGLFSSLGNNMELEVQGVLGVLLSQLLGTHTLEDVSKLVLELLTPVFGLLDSLLGPVLQSLGIQLGYADVTAFHLNCGAPQLVR